MKKTIICIFFAGFLCIGASSPSWAFGSRHHGSHHDDQGVGTGDSDSQDWWSDSGNPAGNVEGGDHWDGNHEDNGQWTNEDNGTWNGDGGWDNTDGGCDPKAAVPEPMTAALLPLGLIGFFFFRRTSPVVKKSNV